MTTLLVNSFIDTVEKYGQKTAIVDYPDGSTRRNTSFDDLLMLSRQVAAYIKERNIAPQSFITIELAAGADFLVAEMGVWMARCVVVPVGPAFPEERKAYIRQHSEAVLNIDRDVIDSILHSLSPSDADWDGTLPDADDNALLIYTSGSTGNPKGILHQHKAIANVLARIQHSYKYGPDDRYAAGAPTYFIVGMYYWQLLGGTEVHFIPQDVTLDPVRMAEYHRDNGITLTYISAAVCPIYRCVAPSLRIVFTGGDRVICRQVPSYRLVVNYGMSETSGVVIGNTITEPTENAPIGKPLFGVEAAILDDDMQPVPQGQEGEICLKGCFCKEYFKDEERTRELYRGGWLHTKDVGRQLPDGSIQFVNRKDWMVKVNGQRVEPGEVEAAMCSIEGISRAVVKGFEGSNGSQYLVAYYTTKNDENVELTEQFIRPQLEKKLPSYMVPSFYVRMDQFPLNANGKIDRKSLQAPDRTSSQAEYVAPRNEIEASLCNYMAQALGISQVGIDDNFRSLGGDSIQMMTLQQLCADSDVADLHNISIGIIYQGATPRKMAEMLAEAGQRTKPQMDDYPLGETSKLYFFGCMQYPTRPVSNLARLFNIPTQVDIVRLKYAIEKTVAAHSAFQTRIFMTADGEPRQKLVDEPFQLPIEEFDAAQFEALKKDLIQPYKHLGGPLFRIRLFSVSHGQQYLFIDISHIICDGTSLRIFFRDIDLAYRGLPLDEEDWSQGQLAEENRQLRNSDAFRAAREWFLNTFDKDRFVPPIPMEKGVSFDCKVIPLNISFSSTEQFCRNISVTVNAITTAAYLLTLGAYTDRNDATILTAYNSRDDIRTRNTIGYLASNILVRGIWTPAMSPKEFVLQVGQNLLDAMGHSIFSSSDIKTMWQCLPIYQFIYQGNTVGVESVDGCQLEKIPLQKPSSSQNYMIQLHHNVATDIFSAAFYFNPQIHDEAFIQRWAQRYAQCLHGLMSAKTIEEAIPMIPQCDKLF